MAIDKNSKAYQWLLNMWYTDNEISQMYNSVSSWQNAKQVLADMNTQKTKATPNYENQWAWNYVYNEKTGYYENTSKPTQSTTTTEVKQETPVKQQETAGSTVSEIKQEWELKPLSQDYYNQTSDEAQSKIINNLNNYRQTNPEYFRDYESFKKNFSYDARNDEQKQTLDSWYGGYQKWMELAWIPVTDLYTQYKDGQVSMNELENLRIYDPTKYAELQAQINKWNIISAYDDDKGVDTTWMNLQDMAYNAAMQMFTQFMSGDSSNGASQYFRDYESKMESPEMLALSDQCTEVQEQMENIQSDLDSIKKSVEEEYEWTWATRSKINAIIADRSYDLQLQLRTLNSEYNKYATQYNNRMQQYQNEFSMQLQEYQLNQQARNQQMQELWFAMDLMNFETNEQKAQREWDYWVKQQEYTNWNINSKDYDTRYKAALKSVQNLLSQYEGIPMQRSAEQMAQDVLKAIDGGSNLWAELTKINKQIQGKPEYKYLYNQTYKPAATSSWTSLQSYKVWDTEYVVYNGEMMTAEDFNSKYWGKATWATWEAKPYDIVDAKVFSQAPVNYGYNTLWTFLLDKKDWNKGWQCGKFVNDYLVHIWMTDNANRYYDNSLATKLNSVNSQVPREWSIAVYDYGKKSSDWVNYGHVAIVTKVYEDWSYDVVDSNFGSDEKIQTRRHLNPQSSSLKGFFDPSQPPAWMNVSMANMDTQSGTFLNLNVSTQNTPTTSYLWQKFWTDIDWNSDWYIKSLSKDYESYLDKGKDAITDGQRKALKEDYWIDEKDFRLMAQNYSKTEWKRSWVEQASKALESAIKLYDMIETWKTLWIKDNPQGWLIDLWLAYIPFTDAGETKAEYKTLMSRLQLNELFNAKNNWASFGAMSDSEWDILWNASTNLKWNSSSKTFKNNLENIIKSLNDAVVQWWWTLPKNFEWSNAAQIVWNSNTWYSSLQSPDIQTTTQNINVGWYYFPSTF